jgi:hypothetical protein
MAQHIVSMRNSELGRGRRCRGALVGHEVSEADIDFMPHGGNGGNPNGCKGATHALRIERRQILA